MQVTLRERYLDSVFAQRLEYRFVDCVHQRQAIAQLSRVNTQ